MSPRVGCVVPVGPGHEDNLELCLTALMNQTRPHDEVVVVLDGPDVKRPGGWPTYVRTSKFTDDSGEQPRNAGARNFRRPVDAVHFVDSDVVLHPAALECMLTKWRPGRIVIGAYDWLPPGARAPDESLRNDPRWEMFWEDRWQDPEYASTGQLNVGLACFGGNLMWDAAEFQRVGGFWNRIHRGEDGELGLRAVSMGIPIQCSPGSRGWHLYHPFDMARIQRENARNIPMIDDRHNELLFSGGVFVAEVDGKRFEQRCGRCGESVSTVAYWEHRAGCAGGGHEPRNA